MYKTLVFLDEGFLYKLSKHIGGGAPIKFDRVDLAKNLAVKEKLQCEKIFYYNAPPYDKFIRKLQEHNEIIVREGRLQRLKIDGKFIFRQKSVDVLLAMDLSTIPIKYPHIKNIILVSSDSDFVPVIRNLEENGIKTILYTYYEKKRNTAFSRSNELIKSVHKYVLLTKEDFKNASLYKTRGDENES